METILQMITENIVQGHISTKKARLLINDEIITGLRLYETLEEMNL